MDQATSRPVGWLLNGRRKWPSDVTICRWRQENYLKLRLSSCCRSTRAVLLQFLASHTHTTPARPFLKCLRSESSASTPSCGRLKCTSLCRATAQPFAVLSPIQLGPPWATSTAPHPSGLFVCRPWALQHSSWLTVISFFLSPPFFPMIIVYYDWQRKAEKPDYEALHCGPGKNKCHPEEKYLSKCLSAAEPGARVQTPPELNVRAPLDVCSLIPPPRPAPAPNSPKSIRWESLLI